MSKDAGLGEIPRWFWYVLMVMSSLALLPVVLIAKARTTRSPVPRVEIIPDMDNQSKFKAQAANPMFADGRAMRPRIAGTVARGELDLDDHYYRGLVGEEWATDYPTQVRVDEAFLQRGQRQFNIYCAPCHGLTGQGDGMIHRRALELQQGTWTPPSDLHTELVRGRAVGELFNTITNGVRNMPSYGSQVTVPDRWAVVAYVRALQRSRTSTLEDVPPDVRSRLERER